jgi:hypothetical protein
MVEDVCNDESCLEDLKKVYLEVKGKFGLPSFEELNEDFQIEKISEIETDFLVKEIRKFIVDKLTTYMNFIETILHPSSGSMFIFSVVKALGAKDKEVLLDVYKKLSKNRIKVILLDVEYSEKDEVEYIKDSFELWQKIKKDILNVLGEVDKNWDNKVEMNGRKYLG